MPLPPALFSPCDAADEPSIEAALAALEQAQRKGAMFPGEIAVQQTVRYAWRDGTLTDLWPQDLGYVDTFFYSLFCA